MFCRGLLASTLILALLGIASSAKLSVSGNNLSYNGQRVFLSGANIAWYSYGYDFGNGQYHSNSKSTLEGWLAQIANAGGNSIRIWVHVEGNNTPAFDGNGYVTGPDSGNTLISDLKEFLDAAKSHNIFVILCLWNGAVINNDKYLNLYWDESKLQSYIDKALKPMVSALAGHPALGAWEIVNEPEGSVKTGDTNSNPCFNTEKLTNSGAGWTGKFIPMQNILKFVNWQSSAIKSTDSSVLVTSGSWCEKPQTDSFGDTYNYYKDNCLTAAGGKSNGILDFYQMHTYSWNGAYNSEAPFKQSFSSYGLSKPLIVGEFASVCSEGNSPSYLFGYAYNHGYSGALSWQYNAGGDCSDSQSQQNDGMSSLKGKDGIYVPL